MDRDPPETVEEAMFGLRLALWDLFETLRSETDKVFTAAYEKIARRLP